MNRFRVPNELFRAGPRRGRLHAGQDGQEERRRHRDPHPPCADAAGRPEDRRSDILTQSAANRGQHGPGIDRVRDGIEVGRNQAVERIGGRHLGDPPRKGARASASCCRARNTSTPAWLGDTPRISAISVFP